MDTKYADISFKIGNEAERKFEAILLYNPDILNESQIIRWMDVAGAEVAGA